MPIEDRNKILPIAPILITRYADAIREMTQTDMAALHPGEECSILRLPDGRSKQGPAEPSKTFALVNTESNSTYVEWYALAAWLAESVNEFTSDMNETHLPLLLIDLDHPWREFLLYLSKMHDMVYGFMHFQPFAHVMVMDYALLTNAAVHVFANETLANAFHKATILPYRKVLSLDALSQVRLPAKDNPWLCAEQAQHKTPAKFPARKAGVKRPIRVLLVAYFTGPCRTVGVARPNYWFDQFAPLSAGEIEIELATATEWHDRPPGVHWVRDHHIASIFDKDGLLADWAQAAIANEKADSRNYNTLSYFWRFALERHFDQLGRHYDIVIISGNPFSCFDFASYAKARWHARVILDYRDPFANNYLFQRNNEQRAQLRYVEKGYNFQADLLVTVNQVCLGLLCKDNDQAAIIVPNGYDDRVSSRVRAQKLSKDKINIVHAGSFYHYRLPNCLVSALDDCKQRFHHIGNAGELDTEAAREKDVVLYGRKSYEKTLEIVAGCDLGVVFISESGFETTTKVFDYIAFGLDILIITPGEPGTGALATVLSELNNVYWVKNDSQSIAEFLTSYQPKRQDYTEPHEVFSRRYQSRIFIKHIKNLV